MNTVLLSSDTDEPPGSGDHICSIYQDAPQQFSSIIPFLIDGLISKQKCVYVVADRTVNDVVQELFSRGFPIQKYIDSKQMVFFSKDETYLSHGYFDADSLISIIKDRLKESHDAGYTGVRASGEMVWALDGGTTMEKLISYESQLNAAFSGENISIFCQYNEQKFAPEILTDIIRTHPKVYVYGKLYDNTYFYTPPEWMNITETRTARSAYKEMIREITEPH